MGFKKFATKDLDIKSVYHLLISGISPRPIALVGSMDNKGSSNLAPFSFFNAFGANPPIVGFSPALSGRTGLPKDTLLNIKETKEFTISIVNSYMVEQISLSSCEFDRNTDEFIKSGLTKIESKKIKPYGVLESHFIMECKLYDIVYLGNKPASGNLILGEIVMFHISDKILNDANKNNIMIVYANGDVDIKRFMHAPDILEGCHIVVQREKEKEDLDLTEFFKETAAILASLATIFFIISTNTS
mgnify:CR=1 FL=1